MNVITLDSIDSISYVPNFVEAGCRFIKIFQCKDGNLPFNSTFV